MTPVLPIEQLPPAATADRACAQCKGEGYVVEAQAELAVARVCACVPACARCGGLGQITALVDGQVRSGRCACQRVPDRVARFNIARVPGRYAEATLATFMKGAMEWNEPKKQQAAAEAMRWLKTWRPGEGARGLVLHGLVGRGKTHLLIALIRELVFRHAVTVRFLEFSRLLATLREGYSEGRSDSPILRELATVEVLAIDELGKGRLTDWELQVIDDVVSRRYNSSACTLGTTNFRPGVATGAAPPNAAMVDQTPQTLGDRVGDRVYSRLREMADFVEVGGADCRELLRGPGR